MHLVGLSHIQIAVQFQRRHGYLPSTNSYPCFHSAATIIRQYQLQPKTRKFKLKILLNAVYSRGLQIFLKSRSHVQILCARNGDMEHSTPRTHTSGMTFDLRCCLVQCAFELIEIFFNTRNKSLKILGETKQNFFAQDLCNPCLQVWKCTMF